MRAVRCIVHSAEALAGSRPGKPPSPYASVYLLGDEEKTYHLTAKTKETKTSTIANSSNPVSVSALIFLSIVLYNLFIYFTSLWQVWEEEFVLHGPKGLVGASALRVKLKDAGTGGFFGDNNLGQVTIPSTCFVPETVATLTLPVEPASVMKGSNATCNDYGEVKVSTELVVMSDLMEPLLSTEGR